MTAFEYSTLGILAFIAVVALEVLKRTPHPSRSVNLDSRPSGSKSFVIWMEVKEIWDIEFEAGLLQKWTSGFKFRIWGDAECNEHNPDVRRATLTVFSDVDLNSKHSEIFGWGRAGTEHLDLSVSLSPLDAASLMLFVKGEPRTFVHAQGYQTAEGELKINYFSCEQRNPEGV